MDYLGTDCPGFGLNIIKNHLIMSAASQIRRFGCIMNADSGTFERLMKFVKKVDVTVGVSRANNGQEEVFVRSAAREAHCAEQIIFDLEVSTNSMSSSSSHSSKVHPSREPGTRAKSGKHFEFGSGRPWASLAISLEKGCAGPAMSIKIIFVEAAFSSQRSLDL